MVTSRVCPLPVPPALAEVGIDRLRVFSVPLTVRFRGIDVREGMLLHGPAGWGECSPFWDYDPVESSTWLRAGVEAATTSLPDPLRPEVPVNVTVPVVDPDTAKEIVASSGCSTAKVKVADPRSELSEDCERVASVREALGPDGHIRVDANAAWDVDTAVAAVRELDRAADGLEYVEQPCPEVADLAALRRRIDVPVAADESVRRAEDPLAVARADAADLLVIKAQPLGGVHRALEVVERAGLPVVVSSALDTAVGIGAALHLAACLPTLDHACGLATTRLFSESPTDDRMLPVNGSLRPRRAEVTRLDEPDEDLCDRWSRRLNAMIATDGWRA